MCYSNYVCGKMPVWKAKGGAKLQVELNQYRCFPSICLNGIFFQELLAKLGIPLQQCKQKFQFMSPMLRYYVFQKLIRKITAPRRAHFRREIMGPVAAEFGFTNPPPVFKVLFAL
jgi:hypothetical protein